MYTDNLLLHIWGWACWLPWLLAGIIPFLLGWLFGWLMSGRFRRRIEELEEDLRKCRAEKDELRIAYNKMEKEDASLRYEIDKLTKDNTGHLSVISSLEGDKTVLEQKLDDCMSSKGNSGIVVGGGTDAGNAGADSDAPDLSAKTTTDAGAGSGIIAGGGVAKDDAGINYASIFEADNLQIVEGIGPKVDGLLKENGINNWAELGATSKERLEGILGDAGLKMMKPDSWPRQAELAAQGKWEELVEYQRFLDTGRATTGDFESPAKVEEMAFKLLGFKKNPEDLKIVEGIGPKIEGLLKDAGINTWAELGATKVERIQEILTAAGDRYRLADPGTWPRQAQLAAEGKWGELQEYQDYLDGGKDPGK